MLVAPLDVLLGFLGLASSAPHLVQLTCQAQMVGWAGAGKGVQVRISGTSRNREKNHLGQVRQAASSAGVLHDDRGLHACERGGCISRSQHWFTFVSVDTHSDSQAKI